jgi:hypothetical protein
MQIKELKQVRKHIDYLFDVVGTFALLPSLCLAANLDIAGLLKDGPLKKGARLELILSFLNKKPKPRGFFNSQI